MSTETEIQTEVDALKTRFSDTKALYREVCALLFFRYGITPTVSKLYQFVRKGSMSAPTEALEQFWTDLRSKARVEIDHPDLPDEIKEAAASAIAAIWRQSSAAAREELRVLREEVKVEVNAARTELATSKGLTDSLLDNIEIVRDQLAAANAGMDALRAELEAERRSHVATAARNQELQRQLTDQQSAQESARAAFATEMDKSRAAVTEAVERAAATERRALLEVDQERQARSKAEKALESVRAAAAQTEDRLRSDVQAMSESNVRLTAKVDGLEATNRQLTASLAEVSAAAEGLRDELRKVEDEAARAKTEAQTLRDVIEKLSPVPSSAGATKPTKARKSQS